MTIPIPSREQPFKLKIVLRALRYVTVILIGFDPYLDNSYYFSRKVNFDAKAFAKGKDRKEIILSMPLSPKQLTVQIYNAFSGDESGFEVEDVSVEKMPAQQLWESDDMYRFTQFAGDFAKKMGEYGQGYYPSKNGEFLIQLLPVIRDENGDELVTPARINRQSGRIQLSLKALHPLSIPIRMFILFHERKHFSIPTRSEKRADLSGLKTYLDMGFPKIEAVYAATKVFDMHPENVGPRHEMRIVDIEDFIDDYSFKKKWK